MREIVILFFLLVGLSAYGQVITVMPVDRPWWQSGTFCELRPDHFHTGLDLRSADSSVGQPLYAIADGYVRRIKISAGGYGRCLYIYHPELDKVSVYAHLLEFNDGITSTVIDSIYQREENEVDLYFNRGDLPVSRGEIVGKMGNSGYSFGPHLHFEIRSPDMKVAYNPLSFLPAIDDQRSPVINALKISNLDWNNRELNAQVVYPSSTGNNRYTIKQKLTTSGRIGLSIRTDDRQQGTHNRNGIYKIEVFQDDSLRYKFVMDSTLFKNERQINTHLDYADLITHRKYYHHLYKKKNTDLRIYSKQSNAYFLKMNRPSDFLIKVSDYYNNVAELRFKIEADRWFDDHPQIYNYDLTDDSPATIELGDWLFSFLPETFGNDQPLMAYEMQDTTGESSYQISIMGDELVPLYLPMTIKIPLDQTKEKLRNSYYLERESDYKKSDKIPLEIRGNYLVGESWRLGRFKLQVDTIPPTVSILTSGSGRLSKITMTDNVYGWDDIDYSVKVDGQFLWLMPDKKSNSMSPAEGVKISKGSHTIEVIATDKSSNQTVKTKTVSY